MRGDFSNTSATDVLRAIGGEGHTGTLTITGADGSASVSFVDGHVVAASSPRPGARLGDRLVGAGYLTSDALEDALVQQRKQGQGTRLGAILVEQGVVAPDVIRLFVQEQTLDALLEIVRWHAGSYEFEHGRPRDVPEVPLAIAVQEALVELARRLREWDELSAALPSLEIVPRFREGSQSTAAQLEPDGFAVLASIDGSRTVRELADDLGYGEFEAARIVYALSLLGIVELTLPDDETGDAATPSPNDPNHEDASPVDDAAGKGPSRVSQALAELRDLPSRPPSSAAEATASAKDESHDASDSENAPAASSPEQELPGPHPDRDVSEFLREISRLAAGSDASPPTSSSRDRRSDDAPDRSAPAAPDAPKRPSRPDDGKRRRRGLFGRG